MRGPSLRPYSVSLWLFSSTYIPRTSSTSIWASIFSEDVVLMMDAGTGEGGDGNPRRPCGSGLGFKPCWPVLCGNENLPIVFWAGITYMIYLRVSVHHLREIPARLGRRQEIITFPRNPSQPPLAAASRGLFRNFHQERPKPIAEPKFQRAQSGMSGHAGGGFPRYGCAAGSLALVARYMPMRWRHRAKLQLHICSRPQLSGCLMKATGLCGLLRTTCWAFRTAWPAQPINPSTA